MILYPPVSSIGRTPDFIKALPETCDALGNKNMCVAVGSKISALVYRGIFDKNSNRYIWAFQRFEEEHMDDEFYSSPGDLEVQT